jgi:hypothetical protein
MRLRRIVAAAFALLAFGTFAAPALADGNNPANPGGATTGYEGQPGNQSQP